jgi:hypothetical protein
MPIALTDGEGFNAAMKMVDGIGAILLVLQVIRSLCPLVGLLIGAAYRGRWYALTRLPVVVAYFVIWGLPPTVRIDQTFSCVGWVVGPMVGFLLAMDGLRNSGLTAAPSEAQQNPIPNCPACGYNLTGNLSGICPECGTPVPPELRGSAAAFVRPNDV